MDPLELWRIDPNQSELRFRVRHAVLREIRGQFHCWGGMFWCDESDPRRSRIHVWVDLSSIDTGSARRDAHILATELFDLPAEPALVFDSDRIDLAAPDGGIIRGLLALNSCRQRVSVLVEQGGLRRDSAGAAHRIYAARGSFLRSALGLRRKGSAGDFLADAILADTVEFEGCFEVTRDEALAAAMSARPPSERFKFA